MPSFSSTLSEAERWHVAHYVKSLQKEPLPAGNVSIQSKKILGEIPMDPNDPSWKEADAVDVRMTGQVHVAPRNQNPTVSMVTVRSVYNDEEIGFHLEWDDRVKNDTHEKSEQADKWEKPDYSATYPPLYPPTLRLRRLRDAAALQFPVKIPEGPIQPHFFLGDSGRGVNLWHWKADTQTVEETNAKGFKTPAKVQPPESQAAKGQAVFEDGTWRLVLKRSLTTEDRNDIQFEPSRLIPVAVHVWDGFNGETGLRRTISSWYFVVMETTVPPSVYGFSVLAIGLAAGLEVFLVRRVQGQSVQVKSRVQGKKGVSLTWLKDLLKALMGYIRSQVRLFWDA